MPKNKNNTKKKKKKNETNFELKTYFLIEKY